MSIVGKITQVEQLPDGRIQIVSEYFDGQTKVGQFDQVYEVLPSETVDSIKQKALGHLKNRAESIIVKQFFKNNNAASLTAIRDELTKPSNKVTISEAKFQAGNTEYTVNQTSLVSTKVSTEQ